MSQFDEKTSVMKVPTAKVTSEARSAFFIVIAGGEVGRMYKLEGVELLIGRAPELAIVIDDAGVSRRHAKIVRGEDGGVLIEDLGSTNGTFCNGSRVSRQALQDGDKLLIGTTTILKFSFQDHLEEAFARRQYDSATRDGLTHCYNKKYLLERLPSELAFSRRHKGSLAVAMIDIDHFKRVNDTHGHLAGDQVLRGVAKVIQAMIRAEDVLARYGGEEFVVIMRNAVSAEAVIAAERIRAHIESTEIVSDSTAVKVTVSVGIACAQPDTSETPEALLRAADEMLYRAKNGGRNRIEVR